MTEEEQRNKFTCQDCDYRKLCMNLERLLAEVKYQRDFWKDRFFFNTLSLPHHFLCADYKGEMRDAFYNSTEVEALKWRPGKECFSSLSCKKML